MLLIKTLNMKTIIRIGILGLFFAFAGCDPLFHINMVNNYTNSIYFASPELNCISLYPDTILPMDININCYIESWEKLKTKDTVAFREYFASPIEEIFCGNDTISFYIFDADTVDLYSWDTIIKYNMVLQRYDLSRQDFEDRNESWLVDDAWFYFPPTESMKHIHMWPPYGTYDRNGRRKEVKH